MSPITSHPTMLEIGYIWRTMLVNHSSVHKDAYRLLQLLFLLCLLVCVALVHLAMRELFVCYSIQLSKVNSQTPK